MKNTIAGGLAFFALVTSCRTPSLDGRDCMPPVDSMTTPSPWPLATRLIGEWRNTLDGPDTTTFEHWEERGPDTLGGIGFVMVGADTVFIEDLLITRTGGTMRYEARTSTQNRGEWVKFTLEPRGSDTLVFTDPAHDFPTEIRYVMQADSAWDVHVGNAERSFSLLFTHRGK